MDSTSLARMCQRAGIFRTRTAAIDDHDKQFYPERDAILIVQQEDFKGQKPSKSSATPTGFGYRLNFKPINR